MVDTIKPTLDLITVVFQDEISLLTIQARSIARYSHPDLINQIVVVINDQDEKRCEAAVESMRHEYGRFASRLNIVLPEAIIPRRETGLLAKVEYLYVSRYKQILRSMRKKRSRNPMGWRCNNGWSMQQAFKMLSASVCTGSHVVFLDAKNHFLRHVQINDFVSKDGRARTREVVADDKQLEWIASSFAVLGNPQAATRTAPPTVTPVVMERAMLKQAVDNITDHLGSLACFFSLRRGKATEFMLLFASVDQGQGRWWTELASGLPVSVTVFTSADRSLLAEAFKVVSGSDALIMGLHRRQLDSLEPQMREQLLQIWIDKGLVHDGDDFQRLFPERA